MNIIVNKLGKQYDIQPCRMCGSKEYSVLDYHTEKEHAIVIDSIKCVDCGKVYFSFKRLVIDM